MTSSRKIAIFFKYSAARRADYKLTSMFTGVEVENMLQHISSRWLSLKNVLTRIAAQWENLKEYFLIYLPKQKDFKSLVESTQRYQRLAKVLRDTKSEIYISFAIHIDFYLIRFQSTEPRIHFLYSSWTELLSTFMSKFIKNQNSRLTVVKLTQRKCLKFKSTKSRTISM